MREFDPKRARGKRPMPLWVDAFHRDTQHLQADEVGAYMLILMAMWTRPSCDLPDDDRRLAKICRVSTHMWRRRIGPAIRQFLLARDGVLISERLQKEAVYTENLCAKQSDRKKGKNRPNPLKNNKQGKTADKPTEQTTDTAAEHPSQVPNYLHKSDADDARAPEHLPAREVAPSDQPDPQADTWREKLCEAMRLDPTSLTPGGRIAGSQSDMFEARKWETDLGLTKMEILRQVREVAAKRTLGPPNSFKYYTPAMRDLAAQKAAPKLQPIEGGTDVGQQGYTVQGQQPAIPHRPQNRPNAALENIARLARLGAPQGDGGA
ncbi:DUF1376 domain-containing protein [Sediminimonas sp.]|uniref:YdaU family protein n=1 Tax=Sediminimonas sp. TaxID=2823379 RepID=UPI0025D7BA38|nr:DUF1376 domain-containing protein [Sediminimonas sp.]